MPPDSEPRLRAGSARIVAAHGRMAVSRSPTSLMTAAVLGDVACPRALIQYGADMDARTRHGGTALIAAAAHGQIGVASLLIEHGCDVNVCDADGYTALVPGTRRFPEMVALLEKADTVE